MSNTAERTNRLAKERSTYLRSAAHQSIEWFPWSEEPFDLSREKRRPVLLDIGASWCHWCHVMDEGTYEDEEISSFINDHYIAVKVDRDERPDVDARYQKAVSSMTGQGGWPLTVFLDDQGRPFYGGTYFPPRPTGELPGFLELLRRIYSYYTTREVEREEVARSVTEAVSSQDRYNEEDVGSAEIRAALLKIVDECDIRNGGFGFSPKFPHTSAIELLLSLYHRGRKEGYEPLRLTLYGMLNGGIHDQLGGGFHRYSTDEKWIVPHFEKMSYDNAGLLRNYTHAYQLFGDEEYRRTAQGIVSFVSGTLSGEDGFFASQDADAKPGDDGDYWTWTPSELAEALEGKEREVAELHFHIRGMAEMHRKDRHVLYRAMNISEVAEKTAMTPGEASLLLDDARKKMLEFRLKRPSPAVDRSVFGNWNGMMASSFFEYSRCFNDENAFKLARRSVDNYIRNAYVDGQGFRHTLAGGGIEGMLDDQVHMLHAALDLFELSSDPAAGEIAAQSGNVIDGYRSPSGGLYDIDTSRYNGEKIGLSNTRNVHIHDSPAQSPVAGAAILLQRAGAIFEDERAAALARSIIREIVPSCISSGVFTASIFVALDQMINGVPLVVVAGSGKDTGFSELNRASASVYLPWKETVLIDTDTAETAPYSDTMQSIIGKTREEGKPLAFFCRGRSCSPPAETAAKLLSILGK